MRKDSMIRPIRPRNSRWIVGSVVAMLAIVFVSALVRAGSWTRNFIYYPTSVSQGELARLAARPGWRLSPVQPEPNVRLTGLVRPPRAADQPWLLFFGGNAMDIGSSQAVLELMRGPLDFGLGAWAYRGYDGSQGTPSEPSLVHDAKVIIEHVMSEFQVPASRLVIIGQSLGTAVAAQVAASGNSGQTPPAGLVLLSPFRSMKAMFDQAVPGLRLGWLTPDAFRTDLALDHYPGPVLIVHGTVDTLIPVAHARTLAELLGDRARLHELSRRGHNDIWDDPALVTLIRQFVRESVGRPAASYTGP